MTDKKLTISYIHAVVDKADSLKTSEPHRARRMYESIIESPALLGDMTLAFSAYSGYSWTFLWDGEFQRSKAQANRALQVSKALDNTEIRSRALLTLANAEYATKEYLSARDHLRKALRLALDAEASELQSRILCNFGRVHKIMGDTRAAVRFYKQALVTCGENHGWQAYVTTLQNLSNLCLSLGDAVSARVYLDKAIAAPVNNQNSYNLISCYAGYGAVCNLEQHYSDGFEWSTKGITKSEDVEARGVLADSLSIRAESLFGLGRFAEAKEDLLKALELSDSTVRTIQYKSKLAKYLAGLDLRHETLEIISEVESGVPSISEVYQDLVYDNLSYAKASLSDFAGAYAAKIKSIDIYDQLYTAQVKGDVVSLRLLMQVERKENQRRIRTLKDRQEKELTKLRLEKLEQQTRQTAMHLAAQTEMLSKFQLDLRRIIRNATDPGEALKEVNAKLKELPCEQIDWLRFESEFANAHPEFKDKLKEKYPELSTAEIRLCTLIRLDLKTPEIARMTCLSERTIETQRLSIRRKLQLSREDNLPEILKAI